MKIIGIYKITNTITNDFYIGSSKDVKHRWENHKCPSTWKNCPNNQLYLDMQRYGKDKFDFEILAEVEIDRLKEKEQQFIETLKPTYNNINAKGVDIERNKEYQKEYQNKICSYNGETLTLRALYLRFRKSRIAHPTLEAKKYILKTSKDK